MMLKDLEEAIMAKPNYFHHAIKEIYPDGVTWLFDLWLTDGTVKHYVAYLQLRVAGWEVIKYKELV